MSIKNYFPSSTHSDKKEFDDLLDQIYWRMDFFSYVTHYKSGRFYYTSPSFELMTGYSVKQFEEEGVNFFVSRIPPEDTLAIMKAQAEYFIKALEPGFDQSTLPILDMSMKLPRSSGGLISLIGSGVPLGYLPNGEMDFNLMIVYLHRTTESEEEKVNTEIHGLLTKVKSLYHRIYTPAKNGHKPITAPVEIVSEKNPKHILTTKEKEVLQKIARGASSKEIAVSLGISENTVETHRKNMLQKFEAKNIAELITKATKLYWLE